MKKIKFLPILCGILMGSTVVVAEEVVESCASGAGTIIYGVVNGMVKNIVKVVRQ